MIQEVVGERGRGATEVAADDVAPGAIAAAVDLPCFVRAGRSLEL